MKPFSNRDVCHDVGGLEKEEAGADFWPVDGTLAGGEREKLLPSACKEKSKHTVIHLILEKLIFTMYEFKSDFKIAKTSVLKLYFCNVLFKFQKDDQLKVIFVEISQNKEEYLAFFPEQAPLLMNVVAGISLVSLVVLC